MLELQEIWLCLQKYCYGSLYTQREPESRVCFRHNGVWGFVPWQGGIAVEHAVINSIQRWERRRRRRRTVLEKIRVFFFKV